MLKLSENDCFPYKKSRILVAISAGMDSVVLAHWLHRQKVDIVLAHCNFQLRGDESDDDEFFVRRFAEQLNVLFLLKRFDTERFARENRMNIQLAARHLRYHWFEQMAMENHCDFIATAHHANDNVETFFVNLFRGAGLEGLSGIPKERGKIIRPLLEFSVKQIRQYAIDNQLVWRNDSSNNSDKYLRNQIRHHIVPKLEEINPFFLENFNKSQTFLKQSVRFIDFFIEKIKKQCFLEEAKQIKIDISQLKQQPEIDLVLYHLFYPYHFKNISDIRQLLDSQTGKQIFSSTHRLLKDRNYLILKENELFSDEKIILNKEMTEITEPFGLKMEFLSDFNLKNFQKNEKIAYIDADLLSFPLVIRRKQDDDYFYPLGMKQKKSLNKFFKDEKYSIYEKETQFLLCSNNHIVWVMGKRLDDRFKITPKTKNVLKIQVTLSEVDR